MTTTLEYRRRQYRIIFEIFWHRNPRVYIKDVASLLQADPSATSRRMREAIEEGYIAGPQVRKRSFLNLSEHVYLVNCMRPVKSFKKLMKDMDVTYHAMMNGFANLWITSNKRIGIKGDVVLEGLRSDYHVSFPPNHSWDTAVRKIQEKIKAFNPKDHESKGIIETHWNEAVPWDSQDETLFREFKYNLRKRVTPIMREHHISGEKLYKWLGRLSECCTIATCYYPEKFSSYDSFLYMFETDYEDFIIDLFSELPTLQLV